MNIADTYVFLEDRIKGDTENEEPALASEDGPENSSICRREDL
jgi:hypothetical protein